MRNHFDLGRDCIIRTALIAFLITLSLFVNFFMFPCTFFSSCFDVSPVIQGWFKIYYDFILFSGFIVNKCVTKSFASSEMFFQSSSSNLIPLWRISLFKSTSLSDSKGGYPHNNTYIMTPIDHQSQTYPYLEPWRISGAMYKGVPTAVESRWVSLGIIWETPKSISLRTLSWFLEV